MKVLTVTGGKGGVGKTNICANLAIAMCMLGRRVMLLDADLGLANVDVLLGLQPAYSLADVVKGDKRLQDVIVTGPAGVRVVPGASGLAEMANLTAVQHAGIIHAFSELNEDLDALLVDTAAGISDGVLRFCAAANEVLVVVCDEPTSITDAYALIKVLSTRTQRVPVPDHHQHDPPGRRRPQPVREAPARLRALSPGHPGSRRQHSLRRPGLACGAAADAVCDGLPIQPGGRGPQETGLPRR